MSRVEILHSSSTNEWFTPQVYIDAVKEIFGNIDLDPASCIEANQIIQAKTIFTINDDGLNQDWFGKVFLNPPYGKTGGKSNQALWSQKLITEYCLGNVTEAILLVNAQTAEKWFKPLWGYTVCFTDHRIKFMQADGSKNQPTLGNAFIYFGQNSDTFTKVFSKFGNVVKAYRVA